MIGQLETNGNLMLFKLARTNFDVEMMTFIGDFQNLGPGKTIDAQSGRKNLELFISFGKIMVTTHLSLYTNRPEAQTPNIMSTPSESLAGCRSTPYMANFLAFSR